MKQHESMVLNEIILLPLVTLMERILLQVYYFITKMRNFSESNLVFFKFRVKSLCILGCPENLL